MLGCDRIPDHAGLLTEVAEGHQLAQGYCVISKTVPQPPSGQVLLLIPPNHSLGNSVTGFGSA